jgi:hypothetical protein
MYRNNFLNLFVGLLFCCWGHLCAQKTKGSFKHIKKVGLLYNDAKQNNILFGDKDYDYRTRVLKGQLFYLIHRGKKWDFNLLIQPQIQFAKHQLLNPYFIRPDTPNYEELRDLYTQEKNLRLYQLELGFQMRAALWKQLYFETTIGLGAGLINRETERLAKGFTFIENFSIGMAYQLKNTELYLGTNIGHVSNFNTQKPNDGYNVLGFELGYRMILK